MLVDLPVLLHIIAEINSCSIQFITVNSELVLRNLLHYVTEFHMYFPIIQNNNDE